MVASYNRIEIFLYYLAIQPTGAHGIHEYKI